MTCPGYISKKEIIKEIEDTALQTIEKNKKKINLIWLELNGCSGNIISLLNTHDPDIVYLLKRMVNLKYNNSLMGEEGQNAYKVFLDTLGTDFILAVEGAVSLRDDGLYNVIANYKGKPITGMEALKKAGERAKYILAVGSCASYGGPSAARPNPSESVSVGEFLKKDVINIPGCPSNPPWVVGTIAHLIGFGIPDLDDKNRPLLFYGVKIHDRCTRRSYFDKRIFAKTLGDPECMFQLGCRGPITKADCPIVRWNDTDNWPIGDNTPCIGCAHQAFPDGMEPFIRY